MMATNLVSLTPLFMQIVEETSKSAEKRANQAEDSVKAKDA